MDPIFPTRRGLRDRTGALDGDYTKTVILRLLEINYDFAANNGRLVTNLRSCLESRFPGGAPSRWLTKKS